MKKNEIKSGTDGEIFFSICDEVIIHNERLVMSTSIQKRMLK